MESREHGMRHFYRLIADSRAYAGRSAAAAFDQSE